MNLPEVGELLPSMPLRADTKVLFLFSSVLRNPHRIHYDLPFAKSDGHSGLVVHGPLQASWAETAVSDWGAPHGLSVGWIDYRPRSIMTTDDVARFEAEVMSHHHSSEAPGAVLIVRFRIADTKGDRSFTEGQVGLIYNDRLLR